ncbi:MAG: hypothetical protein AAFR29_01280 [Pseudomonadota bacterium]
MRKLATASIVVVAFIELALAWGALVQWGSMSGAVLNLSPTATQVTNALAVNLGFMQLLLATALLSALVYSSRNTVRVLLMMVIGLGIAAGFTLSPWFFAIQAVPALFAWVLVRMTSPA